MIGRLDLGRATGISDAELAPLVALIAAGALSGREPRRSAGALMRHGLKKVPPSVRIRVRDAVTDAIARSEQWAAAREERWVALDVAAAILGQSVEAIKAMLRWPQHRRMWAWPQWRGRNDDDWWFRLPAINPATAMTVHTPTEEPYTPLPPGYLRASDVDMSKAPPVVDTQ